MSDRVAKNASWPLTNLAGDALSQVTVATSGTLIPELEISSGVMISTFSQTSFVRWEMFLRGNTATLDEILLE